ncbi:MAG: hypothetical protein RL732_289 [Bacteroidota bacterium]
MRIITLALLSGLLAGPALAQTQPVKVTDLLQIRSISGLTLDPGGQRLLFTVTGTEAEENSKWDHRYVSQLWMAPVNGSSTPVQLTFAKENSTQPAWHPGGKEVAFVRTVDGKPQVFMMNLETGGEPRQLTRFKYGASGPKWLPDGRQLLFTASVPLKDLVNDSLLNPSGLLPSWPTERPGTNGNAYLKNSPVTPDPDGGLAAARAYLELNEKDKKAKVITKLNFQEEATTSGESSFNHVFLISAEGGTPKDLTPGFAAFTNPQLIPGTTSLIVEADWNEEEHPDRTLETQLFVVDWKTQIRQKLLGKPGTVYNTAAVSPSGKQLAFQYGPTGFVTVPQLAVMPLNGSAADIQTIPYDRNKNSIAWSADESTLYFTSPSNGGVLLNAVSLPGGKIQKITGDAEGVGSFDVANNLLAWVRTAADNPFEIYITDRISGQSNRLSSFNTNWLKDRQLSIPEKQTYTNGKGQTIEYWVMPPLQAREGKKYPVVLEIHGGPSAMWGPGESSMWHEFQFWCGKGYGVVYCNPRGSGGYGYDFLRSNVNDWGKGPMDDVLGSLNRALAASPWADTSRLVVTGGSYAGYLVSYLIAHDKRFKAACSQRGVYDLRTFFGEGNAWRLVPNYFGGYPWEKKVLDILERESPINYVQNITTPYLIFHGENDLRTGVIGSEQVYKSLKVLGRPVEYVRHPGATHEITRSGNNRQRIDQMLRTWEFFERYTHSGE